MGADEHSQARSPASSEASLSQAKVLEELRGDLEKQLASNWAMPAVVRADADGQLSAKRLMPLETGTPPISDAQMAELIRIAFERDGEKPVAIAWVRVDIDPPEIISLDFESGIVCALSPRPKEDGGFSWERETSESLDEKPRGGFEEGEELVPLRRGAAEELDARAALGSIEDEAIERLGREVASGDVVSTEDVAEEMIFDLGAVWSHGDVPPPVAIPVSLADRLRQLRDHARTVEGATSLYRFRHGGSIYLFARYRADALESYFLLKTSVVGPGELAEPEDVTGEEFSRLLGLAEGDE